MLGLGCMRLSTTRDRDDEPIIAVISAALDAGIPLLDTASSYCHDETDRSHNKGMIARWVADWGGDRSNVTIATKGGMRRPVGAWVPDVRANGDPIVAHRALGGDRRRSLKRAVVTRTGGSK